MTINKTYIFELLLKDLEKEGYIEFKKPLNDMIKYLQDKLNNKN